MEAMQDINPVGDLDRVYGTICIAHVVFNNLQNTGTTKTLQRLGLVMRVSESTLERWRAERIGPSFLKLGGQVRYRLMDIMAFEDQTLQVMAHQKTVLDYPKQQLRQLHRSL